MFPSLLTNVSNINKLIKAIKTNLKLIKLIKTNLSKQCLNLFNRDRNFEMLHFEKNDMIASALFHT